MSGHENETHRTNHVMNRVDRAETIPYYLDDDYKYSYQFGETNYLDPNFVGVSDL
jgi:hypothetical protein